MLFILGIVCFLLFFVYGLRPLQRWRYRHIPGPCPGWMLGNLSAIVKAGKHEAFRRWAMQYGDVFKILEGGMVTVVVQDPKLARLVNARNHNRHPIPYMETGEEKKFNAAGILFARNAHHRGIRAAWQPMFHAASLQGFCGIFDAAALRLVDRLEAAAKAGDTVDIHSMLGDMTMEISSTTVFGVELGKGSSDAAGLLQASKAFFDAAGEIENIYALLQLMFPPLAPAVRHLATALPTRTYAAGLAGRRAVRAAVTELLRQHKASQAFSGSSSSAGDPSSRKAQIFASGGVAKGSFLDRMAAAVNKETGEAFTETDAVCQAFSFVMAATETATAAMTFAIHLLATHPEAEAKVLAEVDAFGRNATPSFQDLHERFPYIEAVFKESLRMYPPVPLTIREAERELSLGQYAVPAGTYLAVSVYGLQRDPRYWPEPDVFRPERFLQGGDASKEAYMPFGEGTRSCVGQRYAWQEAVLAFVRIYQRTALRLDVKRGKELDVRMSLGLVPRKGVHVQVMLRP